MSLCRASGIAEGEDGEVESLRGVREGGGISVGLLLGISGFEESGPLSVEPGGDCETCEDIDEEVDKGGEALP
jgi:hypothetical protein